MEYLGGGTILNCQTFEEKKIAFLQTFSAVRYIHHQRIAHRDIKPQNILLDNDNSVRLVDFGISAYVPENTNKIISEMSQTPIYAPPEVFTKKTYNPFSGDIWSLGVTFYYLFFGKLPFNGKDIFELQQSILNDEPTYPDDFDPQLVDLIKKMLIKKPKNRISVKEIWDHPFLISFHMNSSMKSLFEVSSKILNQFQFNYLKINQIQIS